MRRKPRWPLVLLGLVLLGAGLFLVWSRPAITLESYHRIELGSRLADAERIIGKKGIGFKELFADLQRRGVVLTPVNPEDVQHDGYDWSTIRPNLDRLHCWEGNLSITVYLDEEGRIIGKRCEPALKQHIIRRIVAMFR